MEALEVLHECSVGEAISTSEEQSRIVCLAFDARKLEQLANAAVGGRQTREGWVFWGTHVGLAGERYWRVHMALPTDTEPPALASVQGMCASDTTECIACQRWWFPAIFGPRPGEPCTHCGRPTTATPPGAPVLKGARP